MSVCEYLYESASVYLGQRTISPFRLVLQVVVNYLPARPCGEN